MSNTAAVRTGAIALLIGATCLSAAPEPHQAPNGAQRLGWLAGCWERSNGAMIIEEQWMRPRGGAMLGMSRTTRRDTVVEFEQLRIFDRAGRTVYAAAPSGQAPAEFETAVTSDSLVTFENPAHDFPQRIIYRRRGADSLIARIEGVRGGQTRGIDFPYRRAACP
jgi:hypothetical protein